MIRSDSVVWAEASDHFTEMERELVLRLRGLKGLIGTDFEEVGIHRAVSVQRRIEGIPINGQSCDCGHRPSQIRNYAYQILQLLAPLSRANHKHRLSFYNLFFSEWAWS